MTSIHFPLNTNKTIFFLSMAYKSWILQGRLRHAMHQVLPVRVGVPSSIHVLTAAAGHHGPDGRVVEIHVEVWGDLPAILDVKQWQGDEERLHLKKRKKRGWSPSFTLLDDGTCRSRSYVCRRSFLVLGHAALQVEGQVVAVHQYALAKLVLKLLHVWLDSREVKFLMETKRRRVGAHGWMEMSKTFADHIQPDLHMITWVSGSRVNSLSLVSLRRLRDSMSLVLWGEDTKFKPDQTTMKPCLVCPSWTRTNMTTMLLPSQPHWPDGDRLDQWSWIQPVTVGSTQFNSKELFLDFRQIKGSFALLAIGSKQAGPSKLIC